MRFKIFTLAMTMLAIGGGAALADGPYNLTPAANKQFLVDNAKKPGVVVLPDGLQYRVLKKGHGLSPKNPMDQVTVYYKGIMINGVIFDQTKAGKPANFQVAGLIRGWVEALPRMHEGDEWEIVLPANLAYGDAGAGGVIPPKQTLIFDMTLLQVTPAAP
ncbi:MAG TPA: FKBP-type peptidyl-prolyl cis-trans isomerase [Rhizomicrobium sp.]|jgi:FKBP-type peptidyl-prolyl cis-trans isomerase FklB